MTTIAAQNAETIARQIITAATAAGIPDGELSEEILSPRPFVTRAYITWYFPSYAFRYRVYVEHDADEPDADIQVLAFEEDPTTPWPEEFYDETVATVDQAVAALFAAQAKFNRLTAADDTAVVTR